MEAFVPPVIALPDRVDAGLAVSRPGEAPAALGETPHQRAARGRGRRRVAGRRPRRHGGPCRGCDDDRTGPLRRGPARPRAGVAPPGPEPGNRQGVPSSLTGLRAPRGNVAAVRAHSATEGPCPPTARPRHAPAGPRAIRHRQTRPPPPRHRCRARRRMGLLGLGRAARHGRPLAARPPRPLAGPGCGREREGDRAGWPLRVAGAGDGAGPHGARRRPLGPQIPRRGPRSQAPRRRGAQETLGPWAGLPAPPGHTPLPELACALGQGPRHGRRPGLCDRPGALIPVAPAGTLRPRQGCPVPPRRHRRSRPLPGRHPKPPAVDALGRPRHRGRPPLRGPRVALDGAPAGRRRGRAVRQHRGRLPQPPARLGADAPQRGLGRA